LNGFVRPAHGFRIRPGHEAEGPALLEVDVRGVSADAKLRRRFFERIEFCEKFRLGQLPLGKACPWSCRGCR
jgi:hypothetical protein